MSPHKKIYLDYFSITEGEFCGCEVCSAPSTEAHAIEGDGMGGRPSKSTHKIENLMAVCRICHDKYGQKKQYKQFLIDTHTKFLNSKHLPY